MKYIGGRNVLELLVDLAVEGLYLEALKRVGGEG